MADERVRSLEEAEQHVRSLTARVGELERRLRVHDEMMDTRDTAWWRRLLFRVDGWPRWTTVAQRPAWRPWRRWWTS